MEVVILSDYCTARTVDDCDVTDDCVIDCCLECFGVGAGAGAECVQGRSDWAAGLSELFLQRTERGTYSSAEHTHLSVCRYSKFVPDAGRPVGLVSGSGSPRWHLLHDS